MNWTVIVVVGMICVTVIISAALLAGAISTASKQVLDFERPKTMRGRKLN